MSLHERSARKSSPPRRRAAPAATVAAEIMRCAPGGERVRRKDKVAREEPLEIRVRGVSVAVTMRTPGHDAELASGFLLTEGLIRDRGDVTMIAECPAAAVPENTINVFLASAAHLDFTRLTRHVFMSSSCGLCGKASIDSVHQQFPPLDDLAVGPLAISLRTIAALPDKMRRAQRTFHQTGGLHAAAIFDARGRLSVLREDVGRHNAVDKVIGWGFLENKLPFESHVLLVSGRASFEILQKALAARIPIVCDVSAPSSLAVEFARESGQTLVGFLREEGMNVYAGAERIHG